jgi:hypothetical protein
MNKDAIIREAFALRFKYNVLEYAREVDASSEGRLITAGGRSSGRGPRAPSFSGTRGAHGDVSEVCGMCSVSVAVFSFGLAGEPLQPESV